MELGGADAVTAEEDRPEALGVASPCAGDDADEAGVMPQGLLEEIQYRAFLDVVAAAAGRVDGSASALVRCTHGLHASQWDIAPFGFSRRLAFVSWLLLA